MKIYELTKSIKVYNFEVEEFHTYFVGFFMILCHNSGCTNIKKGATNEVHYKYKGKPMKAYNTDGVDIYYIKDLARHGKSAFKGFELVKSNKVLKWIGDYGDDLIQISGKHKSLQTTLFDVIKLIKL